MRFPLLFVVTTAMLEKPFGNAIHARVFVLPLLQSFSVISNGRISRISSFLTNRLHCYLVQTSKCVFCVNKISSTCAGTGVREDECEAGRERADLSSLNRLSITFCVNWDFHKISFRLFFHLHFTGLTPHQLFALLHLIISMDSQTQLSLPSVLQIEVKRWRARCRQWSRNWMKS